MARKPRALIQGGLYHVTSRGNERREIFKDEADRKRFLERLAASAETHQVRVYLYCLMSNHIHLLVETPQGNLDRFMGSLLTGYTVYFNRRHNRAGHLMQGRYGAQVVEGNAYLLKLSRYIHLNPVQVRPIMNRPLSERRVCLRAYPWSSYLAYVGKRKPESWLQMGPVLDLLEAKRAKQARYQQYVEAGLAETDEEFAEIMKGRGVAIGSEAFVEGFKRALLKDLEKRGLSEDVSLRQVRSYQSAEKVEEGLSKVVGMAWAMRDRRRLGKSVRGVWAWALQECAGMTQREVAKRMGVGTGSAISHLIRQTHKDSSVQRWRDHLHLLFKG